MMGHVYYFSSFGIDAAVDCPVGKGFMDEGDTLVPLSLCTLWSSLGTSNNIPAICANMTYLITFDQAAKFCA